MPKKWLRNLWTPLFSTNYGNTTLFRLDYFLYPKMNYKALLYVHKRLSRLSRELSFNVYNMPSSFIVQSILIRFYHNTGNNSIDVYHCYLVTDIIDQTFCTTRIHPYIN